MNKDKSEEQKHTDFLREVSKITKGYVRLGEPSFRRVSSHIGKVKQWQDLSKEEYLKIKDKPKKKTNKKQEESKARQLKQRKKKKEERKKRWEIKNAKKNTLS